MLARTQSALAILVGIFSVLISILLFVPVLPVMPSMGLDPSWILAVNEAVAQRLVFGRDILFTAGPLSSMWTQAYHPSTIQLTIIAGALFAVGHAFLAYRISTASHWLWFWWYAIFLVFLMESRDALFLIYPLLVTFLIYRVSLPSSHHDSIRLSRGDTVLLVLSVSLLGLLPIIKLSFSPLTLTACIIGSILLWRSEHKFISISIIALPASTMVLFWAIVGQDMAALPDYFVNNAPLISGFTQAMSIHSDFLTPALFIFSSLLVLYFYYRQLRVRMNVNGSLLLIMIALFLFMSFKAGFVRHDVHALTASSGIVMAAILLGGLRVIDYRNLVIISVMSIVTWSVVHNQHSRTSFEYYKPLGSRLLAMANEKITVNGSKMSLEDRYNAHLAGIRRRNPIPKLQGTADIYPWAHASLIASGNKWSPRPVFQSYSAYTPSLATANLRYLLGSMAPENIVFSVNTIDGRYPSMDDGTSWPTLFAQYELANVTNYALILSKRAQHAKQTMNLVLSKRAQLGESVDTGIQGGIIYAEIEVTPSLFGRVTSFLYKPTALKITVGLSSGVKRGHRFVPGEAITGFVLSPYIADTNDFSKILLRSEAMNKISSVNRFRIEEIPFTTGMWNHDYSIRLYKLAEENNTAQRPPK